MPAPKGGNSGTIKKGQVLNPTGRPKKGESLAETMRTFLEEVPEGQELTYKEMFVKKSYQKAYEGDPTFAKLVWNYIDGMPVQKIDHTSKGERIFDNLSDAELRALVAGTAAGTGESTD